MIDKNVVAEYLELTGQNSLDESKYIKVDIQNRYPVERINQIKNKK